MKSSNINAAGGGTGGVDEIDRDYLNVRVSKPPSVLWLALFLLVIFPAAVLAIAALMGGLMAAAEGEAFVDCFLYIVSNMLQFSNPLTNWNVNDSIGIVVDIYVSVLSLMMFGIVINVVRVFALPEKIDGLMQRRFQLGGVARPVVAFGFLIPLIISLIACFFGILMALAEDWSIHDGILYVIGNLLNLGTPLVDIIPNTMPGDLIDIFISSVALGCVALFVDYVSIVNPSRFVRKRVYEHIVVRRSQSRDDALVDSDDDDEDDRTASRDGPMFENSASRDGDEESPRTAQNSNGRQRQQEQIQNSVVETGSNTSRMDEQ